MPNRKKALPVKEIEYHYLNGMSAAKLSRLYNTSEATIKSRLLERGIHIRTLSEAQQLPPNKGRKISDAHRAKLSASKTGVPAPKPIGFGETLSKRLKGTFHGKPCEGKTPINTMARKSREAKLWREAVFTRDNWTCVMCNKRGGYLEVDHIKPFSTHPDLRLDVNNGRTLCKACHKEVTRQQYINGFISSHPLISELERGE